MTETIRDAERETARIEAFSDGVFAIAITLLVLELHVPAVHEGGLRAALLAQWPSYFGFLTSFATIGIMWLNHHRLFHLIRRVDHTLLLLNVLLLLGVTLVPFPTAVMAEHLGHPDERLAAGFYSATFVYVAVIFNLLWRYAASARRRPPLLRVAHDDAEVRAVHRQYLAGPVVYLATFALAFWNAPASVAGNLLLALWFLLPPRTAAAGWPRRQQDPRTGGVTS